MPHVPFRPTPFRALTLAGAVLVMAGCGDSAAGVGPASSPLPTALLAPVSSAAPSTGPTADPSALASPPEAGGPAGYAAWVERQGFGGSSGLHQVVNEARWMRDHPSETTPFDIATGLRLVDHLAAWLERNPPTECWADYHATVRAALGRMHDGYTAGAAARATGETVPADVAAALVSDADAAYGLAAPAGC
jgi:hypothetical protein